MQTYNVTTKTRKLTTMALLSALAVIMVALIHFPLLPAAPFLEYDPADIAILIGTFLFGPMSGLALTAIVSVLQGLTVSAASGPIGILMHFLATGAFSLMAGLIYRKRHDITGAVLALAAGTIAMTIIMSICNLLLTPIFLGAPLQTVLDLMLPAIVPFNLLKATINSVVTFFVYKPISHLVFPQGSITG